MQTKFSLTLVIAIFISLFTYSQDWQIYISSRVYFYHSSETGDDYTIRADSLTISDLDSVFYFHDNFVPTDSTGSRLLYNINHGSLWGDSLKINGDSLQYGDGLLFLNNQEIGNTWLYNEALGIEITYTGTTDSLVFDELDSVRYYKLSDGSEIIQSKAFGMLKFPCIYQLVISYQLVGIEHEVGLNFNHHNEIYDFEIGDRFVYRVGFGNWMDGDTHIYNSYRWMTVVNKFEIDGLNYYSISTYAGDLYYEIYPVIYEDATLYNYPGEQVDYCITPDLYYDYWMNAILLAGEKYWEVLGHNYMTSEEGKLVHLVGSDSASFNPYHTFGGTSLTGSTSGLSYESFDGGELNIRMQPNVSYATYEAGFGLTHFDWSGFESHLRKDLIGAIKSGDTLGYYFELGLQETVVQNFIIYPNPSANILYFDISLGSKKIYSLDGKCVMLEEPITNDMYIESLSPGTYILRGSDIFGNLFRSEFTKF